MSAQVIKRLNSIFGKDVSKLSSINTLQEQLSQQIKDLDCRLNTANNAMPTELDSALRSCSDVEGRVSSLISGQDNLLSSASQLVHDSRTFSTDNQAALNDIACVRGVVQYTVWLKLLDDLSGELEDAVNAGDDRGAVSAYEKIKEVKASLKGSECSHLVSYASSLVEHWFKVIYDRFVADLETVVKCLGWPFIHTGESRNLSELTDVENGVTRLAELVELMLLIQKQDHDAQYSLPMKVLLKPLRKRFRFHFLGSKATNNPSKCEWYITQLVSWVSSHAPFLDQNLQPVYDKVGLGLPATLEFGQGMVELATEKLAIDLPLVMEDDVLLAHTIDQVIGFARDLSSQLEYSSAQPSPLEPLTHPLIFARWIDMERKFAFEKVDEVMRGEGAWESETDGITPRAAESFLTLLLSVTERYKFLSATKHKIDFLELQVELLEDFRVRLVQLVRAEQESPLTSNLCPILNTVDHVITVISNWADTPFFLQLEHLKCEAAGTEMTNTVFDSTIDKLEYFKKDMIKTIVDNTVFEVKARSRAYRKEVKWFSLPPSPNFVSPAACGMLQILSFQLESARRRTLPEVLAKVWQGVASHMDVFLCKEVVISNQFSDGGVQQIAMDVNTGLLPVFGVYTEKPAGYFPQILDCLKLLKLAKGLAMLTLDTLASCPGEGATNTLKDLGIGHLTTQQASNVINARIDLIE